MSERVTTSAQKTVPLTRAAALERLRDAVAEQESVTFGATGKPDIESAELDDGSVLVVAAFDKDDGRSVAMIDHRGVLASERERWQRHWRRSIDAVFDDPTA